MGLMSQMTEELVSVEHEGDLSGGLGQDAAMQEYLESGQQVLLLSWQHFVRIETCRVWMNCS